MTRLILVAVAILAGPAIAHPGHIGEVAGHTHVGGMILIGLAAAIGLWAALRGARKAKHEQDASEAETDDEAVQEA